MPDCALSVAFAGARLGGPRVGCQVTPRRVCRGRASTRRFSTAETSVTGGDGARGGGSGGDGGDGDGGGGAEVPATLSTLLSEAGKKLETLPPDMAAAVKRGLITPEQLGSYLRFEASPWGFLVSAIKPFRDRFLCDEKFVFKLIAQEVIGNGTSLAGEIIERGKDIVDEIEYVISDLVIGTVVEAAFVWLLAPRIPFPALQPSDASPLRKMLEALPASFFEANTSARSYSLMQRVASVVFVSAQYMAIGFACGIVGTVLVYSMISARKLVEPDYEPARALPEVVPNSLGWGLFLASSSNLRFQAVEGMEIALARALRGQDWLLNAIIVSLRFGNNLYGGVQFVQFFRALGLQDTA